MSLSYKGYSVSSPLHVFFPVINLHLWCLWVWSRHFSDVVCMWSLMCTEYYYYCLIRDLCTVWKHVSCAALKTKYEYSLAFCYKPHQQRYVDIVLTVVLLIWTLCLIANGTESTVNFVAITGWKNCPCCLMLKEIPMCNWLPSRVKWLHNCL